MASIPPIEYPPFPGQEPRVIAGPERTERKERRPLLPYPERQESRTPRPILPYPERQQPGPQLSVPERRENREYRPRLPYPERHQPTPRLPLPERQEPGFPPPLPYSNVPQQLPPGWEYRPPPVYYAQHVWQLNPPCQKTPPPCVETPEPEPEPEPPLDLDSIVLPLDPESDNPSSTALPSSLVVSPLNTIPRDVAIVRDLLFDLESPVQLSAPIFDKYWPFLDNVWCTHQRPNPLPDRVVRIYGACRLNRKSNFPVPEPKQGFKPRHRREGGTCPAKFKFTIYQDGRRVLERTTEPHSHTLDHIDSIKRNSAVRQLAAHEFFKSWEPGGILAFLKDDNFSSTSLPIPGEEAEPEQRKGILAAAGGLYMYRQEIQNVVNSAYRKAFPGQDLNEVKRQMDKYKNCQTCSFRGCNAPSFVDSKALMAHRKSVHGLRSNLSADKIYKCPEQDCYRRKKSKGFTTLLGLEEHLRKTHNDQNADVTVQGIQPCPRPRCETRNETRDESPDDMEIDTESPSDANLALSLNLHNLDHAGTALGEPLTPATSPDDPPRADSQNSQHQPNQGVNLNLQNGAGLALVALSHMERERMKTRIRTLDSERQKIDAELRKLKKAIMEDERAQRAMEEERAVQMDGEAEVE